MQYAIWEDYFEKVDKKLKAIVNKCRKYGADFTYNVVGDEYRDVGTKEKPDIRHFIIIDVEAFVKFADYDVLAVAEVTPSGNIIKKINTKDDTQIPIRFRNSGCVCEHCGINRQRKEVLIIQNTKTGVFKQVGKACCKLYTGGLDAEAVASVYDMITYMESTSGCVGEGGTSFWDVRDVLERTIEANRKVGYIGSQAEGVRTKDLVRDAINLNWTWLDKDAKSLRVDISSRDFYREDEEIKAEVEKIIEYYTNLDDNSDFVSNVKTMLANTYVSPKDIGFLCYLPTGYDKAMAKEAERKAKAERQKRYNTDYFGEVGKRYKDLKVESVECVAEYQTEFGVTSVLKIVLENGYVLTWKASGVKCVESQLYKAVEKYTDKFVKRFAKESWAGHFGGDENSEIFCERLVWKNIVLPDAVSFTVKSHSEYRDQKQTVVSRCVFKFKNKPFILPLDIYTEDEKEAEKIMLADGNGFVVDHSETTKDMVRVNINVTENKM